MKGLAIYTIIMFGLMILACFTMETTASQLIGLLMLSPMLVFAILYLVKDKKKSTPITQ